MTCSLALYAAIMALDDNADAKQNKENEKLSNRMVAGMSLFPAICNVALDTLPVFLVKTFEINKTTKAGVIPQHPKWKKCRKGIKALLKGLTRAGLPWLFSNITFQAIWCCSIV